MFLFLFLLKSYIVTNEEVVENNKWTTVEYERQNSQRVRKLRLTFAPCEIDAKRAAYDIWLVTC